MTANLSIFNRTQPSVIRSPQYWMTVFLLVSIMLLGGASRSDVESLMVLRPISVVCAGAALLTLCRAHLQERSIILVAGLFLVLVFGLHSVSFPPEIWHYFPTASISEDIENASSLVDVWRPISFTPIHAEAALWSLATPIAVFMLASQLDRTELRQILVLLIIVGALSGLLGLLQIVGDPYGRLYLYRITNNSTAVGLFANRNHAALLLALIFPMLSVFARIDESEKSKRRQRHIFCVTLAVVLVPLILVTGSRSGLIMMMLGLGGAIFLYFDQPNKSDKHDRSSSGRLRNVTVIGSIAITAFFILLSAVFARNTAIDRFLNASTDEQRRSDFWEVSLKIFQAYYPSGTGAGSFAEVYQTAAPTQLLSPNYVNHAHNDYIETAVTLGLSGMVLLSLLIAIFFWRTFRIFRMDGSNKVSQHAKFGCLGVWMLLLASLSDYPLRTPIFASIFVILVLWMFEAGRHLPSSGDTRPESKKSGSQRKDCL
jgi:O-antigen ligase